MYFDATDVPNSDSYDPLPEGWYYATIIEAAPYIGQKPAAGEMLKLKVEIRGDEHPEYAGRTIFSYLCINHRSEMARKIARGHLAKICHALDLIPLESPDDLLGAPIMVRLKIQEAQGDYDASNQIAGWAACGADEKEPEPPRKAASVKSRGWK
jgi:hypothetical protein